MSAAPAAPAQGFGRGGDRGAREGDRGRGRGGRGRGRGRKDGDGEKEWVPVTKLGRLVKAGKIKTIEEVYLYSLPVKGNQSKLLYFGDIKN